MSIVDLEARLTSEFQHFQKNDKSSDSLIFLKGTIKLEEGAASLELTVGDKVFNCREYQYRNIPSEGFVIKPGASVVIDTEQVIGLPANVFGLVTGKGKYIFQGILISSGKIDPGFYDQLRIGLYNGGSEQITLKRGDPFCSVCFFQLESNQEAVSRKLPMTPMRYPIPLSIRRRIILFFNREWGWLLTILIALLSLMVSIYGTLGRWGTSPQNNEHPPAVQPQSSGGEPTK